MAVSEADPRTEIQSDYKRWFVAHGRTVVLAVLLALGIRTGVAQSYLVEGPSMQPTLTDGQRVLVTKYSYGLTLPHAREALWTWSRPEVGQVVIVASPVDGTDLVKRVVGLPGDTIEVRDGRVLRNGVPLATGRRGACKGTPPPCHWMEESVGQEQWRTWESSGHPRPAPHAVVVVPADHVYVLGDHRDRSNDSRYFGAVPVAAVRGRVALTE